MNLDQIALRISNPNSLITSETAVLQELSEKYPYSQVFSILYLKSLSLQNDVGFDEALQKHAYRITDRMKLYDLIHNQSQEIEVQSEEKAALELVEAKEEIKLSEVILTSTPEIEDLESVENENLITAEEDDLLQDISSEILFEKGLIDEKIESENEITFNPEVEVIEKQILENTDSELIDLEEIDEDPTLNEISQEIVAEFQASNDKIEEKTIAKDKEIEVSKSQTVYTQNDIPELDLEIISEIVETIYSDNLEKTLQKVEDVEKKSEINQSVEKQSEVEIESSKMSFTSWLKTGTSSPPTSATTENKKTEKQVQSIDKQKIDIIDNFIKTEPKISKVKKEFYSPSKKAKESISTEGLIYSETLAEIFAIQGNFPKAITAYQQLMLTNPEKKIFFAKRIEELKEKLNT